jgi:hypothetical protein
VVEEEDKVEGKKKTAVGMGHTSGCSGPACHKGEGGAAVGVEREIVKKRQAKKSRSLSSSLSLLFSSLPPLL